MRWSYDDAVLQVQARRRNLRRTATTTTVQAAYLPRTTSFLTCSVTTRSAMHDCGRAPSVNKPVGERGGCTIRTANDNAQLQTKVIAARLDLSSHADPSATAAADRQARGCCRRPGLHARRVGMPHRRAARATTKASSPRPPDHRIANKRNSSFNRYVFDRCRHFLIFCISSQ